MLETEKQAMEATESHVEKREAESRASLQEEDEGAGVPKGYWTSFKFLGSLFAIFLMSNNLFIGYSMPVNVLGVMDAEVGPDPNIYLVSLVNTLLQGVLLLMNGSISDIVGRRWFIIGGQLLAVIGSIIAATAKNVPTLIGANIFVGCAGSVQVLFPLLVHEIVPNKYRGYGQAGAIAACFPTLGLGPVFARMFVEYTTLGWRWIYWLNVISAGASLPFFYLCYHPPGFKELSKGRTMSQMFREIDYLGFALYFCGIVCLLLSLSWGGAQYAWNSGQVIGLLVGGFALLAGFIVYEIYVPKQPIFPMKLFKIRNFNVAVVVGCVGQMAYYAFNVMWPQHIVRLGYATDNLTIGFMSTTTGVALAAGEMITGNFCKKGYRIKLQMILGMVGMTVFCGIMSLGDENNWKLALSMTIVVGLFVGWIELVSIVICGLVIPPELIGTGQAFFASARAVSGTLVASIYVATQVNEFGKQLPQQVTVAAESSGFPTSRVGELLAAVAAGKGFSAIQGLTESMTATISAAVTRAFALSYRTTYLTSMVWCGLALGCCFLARSDVDQYFTKFVNKTVDAPHIEAKKMDVEQGRKHDIEQ